MEQKMNNATVVVIGGLSGIGRAVAEQAAASGARVIAAGRRASPGDFPATIETAQVDIGDAASVARFFDAVGAFDHLVVTAGPVIASARLADLKVDDAIAAFNVKFFGQLRVAQAAIGTIKPTGSITLTPGLVETGMWGEMSEADRKAMAARAGAGIPVGRVGQGGDLAQAYLMLMQNGYMSGSVVDVDGGGLL